MGPLAVVDARRHAQLLLGQPALARLPISLGEVRAADAGLVDPDAARSTMRSWQPSTAADRRRRRSQAAWRLMRKASAQASGGTESSASPMKGAQAASGFLQPSGTVPASGVNLAPLAGHLRLRTPEGPNPSLQAG